MKRREFLKSSAMAGAVLAFGPRTSWSSSVGARIEVLLDEPVATISPNLYGHFTEHIGGVIYDGVWVGRDSKIPNQNGIRSALIDHLKQIKIPVIRWPGGCFADSYDWRDGIGPVKDRPRRTNFWEVDPDAARLHEKGPQIFDPNEFGTNEFVQFCRLSGAEPYLAANLRSLSALDFDHWVEYCNSPAGSTTLAEKRGAQGYAEPFNVRYWGVGNESWGCGGNFTPEDYATEFRRFTTWVPSYGMSLQFIGSGPNGNDIDWTHRFFEKIYSGRPFVLPNFAGWSVHHYSSNLRRVKTKGSVAGKGDALEFDRVDWYEILREANRMENILGDQWAAMSQYDRDHRVKLVVDEYGAWYREGTEIDPSHIFGQQITMRDALVTALTLDIFNRNAEKMTLAACAQLINNLNALFLAHGDQFVATPNFHVFAMYSPHQGAQAVRADFSSPLIHYNSDDKPAEFWGLAGSASRAGNKLTVTVVNPDLDSAKLTQIAVPGVQFVLTSACVLMAQDIHAHNTLEQPDNVRTQKLEAEGHQGVTTINLPPSSISRLDIDLNRG